MTETLPRTLKKGREFKQKLAEGRAVSGAWSTLGSTEVACLMARAGLDYLLVDLEHGRGGIDALAAQVQALSGYDTAVMVRLPDHDTGSVKRCLDAGANALLVPQVDTAAMAEAVLEAALFPGAGRRGVAVGAIQAADWGYAAESYYQHANDALTVLMQIESPEALDNFDAILAVPRLDGIFVGPNDLSATMGLFRRFDAPEFRTAFDRVLEGTLAAGKVFGALPAPGLALEDLVRRGAQVVPGGSDQSMLRAGAQALIAGLKAAGTPA
ncbi:HpcH/HpaI aldolase family protein [Marinovum sp.]|uniref:HpcH/HpaI aldolase family protein n=1 Tax=Marinovum sp. TaxID=2024839 RepID=UPI002B27479F|nr:aldolase/citrate lyase family protein [Marinovum sp.]